MRVLPYMKKLKKIKRIFPFILLETIGVYYVGRENLIKQI